MTEVPLPVTNFVKPDPVLTNKIITHLKSKGIFDQFRKECVADVDTKPAYQNLRQRVDGSVAAFLKKNPWRPDMNKNLMREKLRKHIQSGGFLELGVDRIVDQVVNPKIYRQFLPKVQEVVHNYLHIDKDGKPVFDAPPSPKEDDQSDSSLPEKPIPGSIPSFAGATKNVPVFPKPTTPRVEVKKPPDSEVDDGLRDSGSPDIEEEITAESEPAENTYVMDDGTTEDNAEGEADDDDEESPPFETHSEGDRLILGVRTDSSDASSDSQLQTTIVDETTIIDEELEKKIVCETTTPVKEEAASEEEKKEESSSDEYVPKTPTINMEASDGSVIEFETISEYKQYQTKYDEESFGNVVEEVVASQWDESSMAGKDKNDSCKEEDSESNSRKRKNTETFDEASNSSLDKGSTSDEAKSEMFEYLSPKKPKTDESEHENDTSEMITDTIDEDSMEKPVVTVDAKLFSDHELKERHKSGSSTGSKESGRSRHSHKERERSSHHHHSTSSKEKSSKDSSSYSSKDRKDSHRRDDKHEHSKDKHKDQRDKKKTESSSSRHDKESKSKHDDKTKDEDKIKHDKEGVDKDKKESKHDHREKSREHHDKEKKKHDSHSKQSDVKVAHHDSHRHDKDKKDTKSSTHSHSSSKHSHRSSSEKHKSKSERSHKDSSDKHHKSSHEKKSEKDKEKKKQREHCKSEDKLEGRRSSDRDSNGPSGRSNSTSVSKSSSSRGSHSEPQVETEERTTSNSDNTVSDNVESLHRGAGEEDWELHLEAESSDGSLNESHASNSESMNSSRELEKSDSSQKTEKNMGSSQKIKSSGFEEVDQVSSIPASSIHDTSSEKENIDQTDTVVKFKKPKIAANIHEVRKIMQARRHMKRMEKKRLKLLNKNHSQELDDSTSPTENHSDEQEEVFHGFDEPSLEKVEKYDCLITRLSSEIAALGKVEFDPNLITSWIEVSPDLDEYIENVLNGKVHRKTRVHLPPISEDHYQYDPVLNVYNLIQTIEDSTDGESAVDTNMNITASPVFTTRDSSSSEDSDECRQLKRSTTFNGNNSKRVIKMLSPDKDSDTENAVEMSEVAHRSLQSIKSPENPTTPMFNLTFNETYDEILKGQDNSSVSKQLEEITQKNHRTVVKITHSKTSEEMIVKEIEPNVNALLPTAKSCGLMNGSITSLIPLRKIPLISKVNKAKKPVLTRQAESAKPQQLNGIVSPDSTTHCEMAESDKIPLQLINDVIGIPHLSRTDDKAKTKGQQKTKKHVLKTLQKTVNQNSPPETCADRVLPRVKPGAGAGAGGGRVQRYDSSDLYKPRPQLTSRRRGQVATEESTPSLTTPTKSRKRLAPVTTGTQTQPKRKR